MLSRGNSEQDKKALLILVWTSIGMIAMLSSYAILQFIFAAMS